jgi:hypothetical protein
MRVLAAKSKFNHSPNGASVFSTSQRQQHFTYMFPYSVSAPLENPRCTMTSSAPGVSRRPQLIVGALGFWLSNTIVVLATTPPALPTPSAPLDMFLRSCPPHGQKRFTIAHELGHMPSSSSLRSMKSPKRKRIWDPTLTPGCSSHPKQPEILSVRPDCGSVSSILSHRGQGSRISRINLSVFLHCAANHQILQFLISA